MRRFILAASLLFKNLKVCPKECSVVLFQPLQESSYKSQAGTKKKIEGLCLWGHSLATPLLWNLCVQGIIFVLCYRLLPFSHTCFSC